MYLLNLLLNLLFVLIKCDNDGFQIDQNPCFDFYLTHSQCSCLVSGSDTYDLICNGFIRPEKSFNYVQISFNGSYDQLPHRAFDGVRVKELYLNHMKLQFLNDSDHLWNVKNVKTIDLSSNKLTSLDFTNYNLWSNVRDVNLANNPWKSLNIQQLLSVAFRVERLNLDACQITELPDMDAAEHLKSRTILHLYFIKILKLANNSINPLFLHKLATLPSLTYLDLTSNKIDAVPILTWNNVEILSLKRNLLSFTPAIISTTLKKLDLSQNLIETIPRNSFHFSPNLTYVKLSKNRIRNLSDFTINMSKFNGNVTFDFTENPIQLINDCFAYNIPLKIKIKIDKFNLKCSCALLWLTDYMDSTCSLSSSLIKLNRLRCTSFEQSKCNEKINVSMRNRLSLVTLSLLFVSLIFGLCFSFD